MKALPALFLAVVLGVISTCPARGQKKPDAGPPPLSSLRFDENAVGRYFLNVGREYIENRQYSRAVEALQKVLNESKDQLIQMRDIDPADPKKYITRWVSAKQEANTLIGSMPAKGLEAYESAVGEKAKTMLDAAKKKKDAKLIAQVAQRYRHTKAGAEAYKLLAADMPVEPKLDGWPSWRGNRTNTGQAAGNPPTLDKKLWSRPIFSDLFGGDQDDDKAVKARVDTAIKQINDLKQPVLPGFFPIATKNLMIYRNHRGICAVAVKRTLLNADGDIVTYKAGQFVWKSIPMDRSPAYLLQRERYRQNVIPWLDEFEKVPAFNSLLYENSLLGTLTADQHNVYAINDLAVPPRSAAFTLSQVNPRFNDFNQLGLGDMKRLVTQNELMAYDIETGKLRWDFNAEDALFKDSHFLSVPISVGGKLYVLNEKLIEGNPKALNPGGMVNPLPGDSELRLICIDPTKLIEVKDIGAKPTIEKVLPLGKVVQENRFVQDIGRRINAAQPAFSDGVLVCPTNAGEVFGIDLMTRSLAWSYGYRENAHQPIVLPVMPPANGKVVPPVVSKWKSAPPAIADGKVVFTAPDADSVHCIQLRDGKPLWRKSQQKGDLYLAGVVDGRVLIVAEKSIRALDLKDGKQLWSVDFADLPSGQGVASKGIYYLPLTKGILPIDLAKGESKKLIAAKDGPPGNLVFYDGMLLSQTVTNVSAYPLAR